MINNNEVKDAYIGSNQHLNHFSGKHMITFKSLAHCPTNVSLDWSFTDHPNIYNSDTCHLCLLNFSQCCNRSKSCPQAWTSQLSPQMFSKFQSTRASSSSKNVTFTSKLSQSHYHLEYCPQPRASSSNKDIASTFTTFLKVTII